jgi:hypothetical protein
MKIKDRAKPKIPPVEAGVYMAVCIGFIDLGEQYSEKFKNYSSKGMYVWELPGETVEVDGEQKPRQLSKEFTISGSSKGNLRKFIESWNGKSYSDEEFMEFDLFEQIGKPCQLNVVLNETKEYANVDNLMPIPRGFPAPTTDTKHIKWDMDKWDDAVFAEIPEWIQEKIKKSTQYQKDHAPDTTIEVNATTGEVCPI